MPETLRYALIMFAAGLGIPVLASLNAGLGQRLGSPAAAATVLFVVALVCAFTATLLTGPQGLTRLPGQPPHLFLAGALVAFYILSITWIAPQFGIGNAIFCVLFGQLVCAAAIDLFGLLGAPALPLTPARLAGLALIAAGIFLTQKH